MIGRMGAPGQTSKTRSGREAGKMNAFSLIRVSSRAMRRVGAAMPILFGAMALQSTAAADDFIPYHEVSPPIPAPIYNEATDCYDAPSGLGSFCPRANNNGGTASTRTVPYVDPCFIEQNAMRPCTPKIVGVDPKTIGTWKLPFKGGPWVWVIHRDGTYEFHSEAGDGAEPNAGKFAAKNGHWMLKATSGYTDAGIYRFQGRDTWIATGQWGTAPWRLDTVKAVSSKPPLTVRSQPVSPGRR